MTDDTGEANAPSEAWSPRSHADLTLLLRQQKTILEELRVLRAIVATKADIADLNGRIGGLYDAYADMARVGALTLERVRDLDAHDTGAARSRVSGLEKPP